MMKGIAVITMLVLALLNVEVQAINVKERTETKSDLKQ